MQATPAPQVVSSIVWPLENVTLVPLADTTCRGFDFNVRWRTGLDSVANPNGDFSMISGIVGWWLTAAGAAAAYCLVKRWPTRGVVERSVPEDLPAWRRSTLRYPAEIGTIMVVCEALWMEVTPGRDRESWF